MIEALAIFFVGGTAFIVWTVCLVLGQSMKPDAAAELERQQAYVVLLEDRWRQAREKNYDDQMKEQIVEELWRAEQQLHAMRTQLP